MGRRHWWRTRGSQKVAWANIPGRDIKVKGLIDVGFPLLFSSILTIYLKVIRNGIYGETWEQQCECFGFVRDWRWYWKSIPPPKKERRFGVQRRQDCSISSLEAQKWKTLMKLVTGAIVRDMNWVSWNSISVQFSQNLHRSSIMRG